MDCMPQTQLISRQEFGSSFVYTKYFVKIREQQKRRRSIDYSMNRRLDENRRNTINVAQSHKNAAMDEETILPLYNYLLLFFTRAKQYAVIHKCLCNALRTRPNDVNRKKVQENRKKFSETLEQITTISHKIEEFPIGKAGICQLILQRNVRLHAIMFIEDLSLRMSEDMGRIYFVTEELELEECIEQETSHYCGARSALLCLSRNRTNNYGSANGASGQKKLSNSLGSCFRRRQPAEECGLVHVMRSLMSFSIPSRLADH